ncbi:YcjX family protein [Klebsiella pneumoniae subsp. pneumoniae]|nr:YcjX family protein [Klebsiella pneumoniae subsp. pneumoniae]
MLKIPPRCILEIVEYYPGEWLLDLPMLAQDYLKLVATDDRAPAGTACGVVGPLAAAVRRAGSARPLPTRLGWRISLPPGRTISHACKA